MIAQLSKDYQAAVPPTEMLPSLRGQSACRSLEARVSHVKVCNVKHWNRHHQVSQYNGAPKAMCIRMRSHRVLYICSELCSSDVFVIMAVHRTVFQGTLEAHKRFKQLSPATIMQRTKLSSNGEVELSRDDDVPSTSASPGWTGGNFAADPQGRVG